MAFKAYKNITSFLKTLFTDYCYSTHSPSSVYIFYKTVYFARDRLLSLFFVESYNSLVWRGPLNIGKQGLLQLGQVAQSLV